MTLHMANGPEPELAKHAPRTSGHTSLKQEHQRESESPQLDSKPRVNNPSNCVFPFDFTLPYCRDRIPSFKYPKIKSSQKEQNNLTFRKQTYKSGYSDFKKIVVEFFKTKKTKQKNTSSNE